jgi:hypothetical protein
MNGESQATIRFLEALQNYRTQLNELRNVLIRNGAPNAIVDLNLSGSPFSVHEKNGVVRTFSGAVGLGLRVIPAIGAPKDFDIQILWDADKWYIDTEIWVDDENVNQRLVRDFPERCTASLEECLKYVSDAIDELRRSDELSVWLSSRP